MTAIAIATQIPSQIVTAEQLAGWAGLALAYTYPELVAIEGSGYSERCAQGNIFYIPSDNRDRLIIRLSLPISADFRAGGRKTWMYIQELGNTQLPAAFTGN